MTKWRYGVDLISIEPGIPRGDEGFTSSETVLLLYALDQWGEEGWELVAAHPPENGKIRAIFKKLEED